MQALMDITGDDPEKVLRDLAKMLGSPQIPVQKRVADDLGVDQPFVSNARNGRLRRVTPRVLRLLEYATMRIGGVEAAMAAVAEMDAEIAAVSVMRGKARGRRPTGGAMAAAELADGPRRYDEDALNGVRAYLEDGYDPRLIVEQLAVLRRAQRVRRPGRQVAPGGGQAR